MTWAFSFNNPQNMGGDRQTKKHKALRAKVKAHLKYCGSTKERDF